MQGEIAKQSNRKSSQRLNLPQINHSRSMPVVQPVKKQQFNLRFNQQMPNYNPNKDKFLHVYFDKNQKQKITKLKTKRPQLSSREHKITLKTQPSQQKPQPEKTKRIKLQTLQSQSQKQEKIGVSEISKQQFGSYMQMMRDKLSKRQ